MGCGGSGDGDANGGTGEGGCWEAGEPRWSLESHAAASGTPLW